MATKKTFADWYKTDVTKHIEKKGKFSYLSWVYAVKEYRKAFPHGTWDIIKDANGQPYFSSEAGCFVEVRVTPDVGATLINFTQIHPVLDHRNQSITKPNAFQVNTSIQRCLVKAIAIATGIGLHIYAGEDLPEDDEPAAKKKTQAKTSAEPNWQPLLDMLGKMSLDALIEWKGDASDEKGTYKSAVKAYGQKELDECFNSFKAVQEEMK